MKKAAKVAEPIDEEGALIASVTRTIGEALRGVLSDEDFARFEKHVRPLVDAGRSTLRSAFAYLRAVKM